MRLKNKEGTIFTRKNLTLPEDFQEKLDKLKPRLGTNSESEIFRRGIVVLSALADMATDPNKELVLRDKKTKEETKIFIL